MMIAPRISLYLLLTLLLIIGEAKDNSDNGSVFITTNTYTSQIQSCPLSVTNNISLQDDTAEFFSGIFSTDNWPARWYCGIWTPFHGWLSITSNFLVWLTYFTIPGLLLFFLHRRKVPKEFTKVLWLFVAFILCCGLTHLMEVVIFWWPAYRLSTIFSFITASVSIATVFSLVRAMPSILKYKGPAELKGLIQELEESRSTIHRSEHRFRQLLESTPDAMVIVKRDGSIDFVNAQTESLFGYNKEELIGKKVEILLPDSFAKVHTKHRDKYVNKPKTRMMGEGQELTGQRKNGETFPVEISLNPIETVDEYLVAAGIRDITKTKKAEETILNLNQGLEQKVEERTKLLSQKTVELEKINRELKYFAYVASHDLKAPLANIESLVHVLEIKGHFDHKESELLNRITNTVRQSRDKIEALNDVLAVRSIEKTDGVSTNVLKVITESLQSIDELIKESHSKITLKIGKGVFIPVPAVYLATILQNLITNAIKYKKENENSVINISSELNNHSVAINISDNGRGIDLEKYGDKFFGLFQRFHLDVDGKGVGLYITKSLIENFGGRIEIDSEVGVGSTFKLIFPINR